MRVKFIEVEVKFIDSEEKERLIVPVDSIVSVETFEGKVSLAFKRGEEVDQYIVTMTFDELVAKLCF
ncbi:MAG: hypothetical protein FWE22_02190 [Firmicutes bacterium]|nr:hypothetical protein [Bacillota bacterium]